VKHILDKHQVGHISPIENEMDTIILDNFFMKIINRILD